MSGPWIQTYSGRAWSPDDVDGYPYDVAEIAHCLARLCRFAGHTNGFYSVAQHSVLVAREVARTQARSDQGRALVQAALLHDAAEAFCVDLPSPIKRLPELAGYRTLIAEVERAIATQFDLLEVYQHPAIRQADLALLATERRDVLTTIRPDVTQEWPELPPPTHARIHQLLTPVDAEGLFLSQWRAWR